MENEIKTIQSSYCVKIICPARWPLSCCSTAKQAFVRAYCVFTSWHYWATKFLSSKSIIYEAKGKLGNSLLASVFFSLHFSKSPYVCSACMFRAFHFTQGRLFQQF